MTTGNLSQINFYPIKSFAPVTLAKVILQVNEGIRDDRRFGFCFGDPSALEAQLEQEWKPWNYCHTLKFAQYRDLAKFKLDYNLETSELTLRYQEQSLSANPTTATGRTQLEKFVQETIGLEGNLADMVTQHVWDRKEIAPLTLVNLASCKDLGTKTGYEVEPLRMRANLLVEGLEAWVENSWAIGQRFTLGEVTFEVSTQIKRCPATKVNPATAEIDCDLPADLAKHFGHTVCGIGVKVVVPATLTVGDQLQLIS